MLFQTAFFFLVKLPKNRLLGLFRDSLCGVPVNTTPDASAAQRSLKVVYQSFPHECIHYTRSVEFVLGLLA
jgi:hypothetical protein